MENEVSERREISERRKSARANTDELETNGSESNVTKFDSRYAQKREPISVEMCIAIQEFLELQSVKGWKE